MSVPITILVRFPTVVNERGKIAEKSYLSKKKIWHERKINQREQMFHAIVSSSPSSSSSSSSSSSFPPSCYFSLMNDKNEDRRLRTLLADARQNYRDCATDANDEEALVDAVCLVDARKLCLASHLWQLDYECKETVGLLESIIGRILVANDSDFENRLIVSYRSLFFAHACELLCLLSVERCLNNGDDDDNDDHITRQRIFQMARWASLGDFDTPFANFLTFVEQIWQNDKLTTLERIPMKNGLSYAYRMCTELSLKPTLVTCSSHLRRSAFDGLVEAQELLVLLYSYSPISEDRKLATFIAWSFNNSAIDQLIIRNRQSTTFANVMDKILLLTGFDISNNGSSLWIRRLRRLSRQKIQKRLAMYCNNCLFVDFSLEDCSEVELIQCPSCRFVGYCSENCQKAHWQSNHQFWCRKVPKDFKVVNIEHVPELMVNSAKVV